MYYDDFYEEPSEFELQVNEFKESLRLAVKKQYQDEMNRLRSENNELQETKNNFNAIKRQYEDKLRELATEKQHIERNAKRMVLKDLFGEMNMILHRVTTITVYSSKCTNCDADRKIPYESPSGKQLRENCACGEGRVKYVSLPYHCTEFRVNAHRKSEEAPLLMWYKPYREYSKDYDGYTFDSSDLVRKVYHGDLNFETIRKDNSYHAYFRDEVDCVKYCNWLNAENGITEDMKAEK